MAEGSRSGPLLVAGFAALLALLVAATLLGIWRASDNSDRLEQVVAEYNGKASLAYRMRALARERMVMLWKMTLSDDPFQREEFFLGFMDYGGRFISARDDFAKADLNDTERKLLKRLLESTERAGDVSRTAAQQMIESGGSTLRREILEQALPAQDLTLSIIDELIQIQAEKSRAARRSVAADNERTIYIVLALMLAALMLGGILAGVATARYRTMLDDRRKAGHELDRVNHELEQRIAERTRQLSEANARLEEMAHHDALTGLANRHLLTTQLQLLLAQAARAGTRLALLFIDLDGFKEVNDRLGHEAGDLLLAELAAVLRSHTRRADLAARVGGDEFVVVLHAVRDGPHAINVAEKVIAAWQPHAARHDDVGRVTLSIGVSLYPDDAESVETLLRHADSAMYAVKRGGKNGCRVYSEPKAAINAS